MTVPRAARRPKKAPPKGTAHPTWPDAVRAEALHLYSTLGSADASRQTSVPKSTIRRWAKAAGVDQASANAAAIANAEAATAASLARRAALLAESREQLAREQLLRALEATAVEREMLAAMSDALVAARADPNGAVPAAMLARLSVSTSGHSMSEIVGLRTRAIHDLQLLEGKATEQPTGGLTVVFATPTPAVEASRPVHLSIVDLPGEDPVDAEFA